MLVISSATLRDAMELLEEYAQECEKNADTQMRMGQYDYARNWQEQANHSRRVIKKMQYEATAKTG